MNLDFLYYNSLDDALGWEVNPPGMFSVERFIKDDSDCWQQEKGVRTPKKRTLILADYVCALYSEHELTRYVQGLYELQSQGFSIWAWQKNDLVLLQKSNLTSQITNVKMGLCLPDQSDLVQACVEHNIPPDQVAILDYIACRKLFFHETEPRLESHVVNSYQGDVNTIIDQLAKLSLQELTLVRTCYGQNNSLFPQLLQKFSCLSLREEELKSVRFNKKCTLDDFFKTHTVDELQPVTDVEICGDSTGNVKTVVTRAHLAPHMRQLRISNCAHLSDPDVVLGDMKLPDLVTLDLYGCPISHTLLAEFLKRAPNLKTLKIDCCEIEGNYEEPPDLPHLEVLDIRCSNIGTAWLGKLLAGAPNLKIISLTYLKNVTCAFAEVCADRLQLHSLEILQLFELSLSAPFFEQIVRAAPNIKNMGLWSCKGFFDFERFRECADLRKLEEFRVSDSSISLSILLAILEKTEKLQKLAIKLCPQIGSPFDYDAFSALTFAQLTCIEISSSAITLPFLQLLLSRAPNIQTLEVLTCENLKGSFSSEVVEGFSFYNLQKLWVMSCSSQAAPLAWQILKRAPNIEEIDLGARDVVVEEYLDDMTLGHLKYLRCPPCSTTSLQKILAKSQELVELNIDHGMKFSGSFDASLQLQLSKLKKLRAYKAPIDSASLVQILQSAPNLEDLDLRGCPNLSGPITSRQLDQITLQNLQTLLCTTLPQGLKNRLIECSPNVKITTNSPSKQEQHKQTERSSTYQVAASTGSSFPTFYLTRVFESKDGDHPPLRDYRLDVYDSLRFGSSPPFEWYNAQDITLTSCTAPPIFTKTKEELDSTWDRVRAPGHKFYLATYDMPHSGSWIPLPSYYADETITHIYADGDLLYSEKQNLYYLNLRSDNKKIYFIIKVPTPLPITLLGPGVQALINKYRKFTGEDPEIASLDITGKELVETIIEQKRGVCCHRAVAFYHEIKKDFPHIIPRLEGSGSHDVISCRYGDRWVRCDLGGGPGNEVIDEKNHQDLFQSKIQISDSRETEKSIFEYLNKHIIRFGKKSLIKVHSQQDLEACKGFIGSGSPRVIYADSLAAVQPVQKSILVVNLSMFDADDIEKLLQMQFGASTCFIGIYIVNGSFAQETEEFLAFFDTKLELLEFEPKVKSLEFEPQVKSMDLRLESKVLETLWNITDDTVQPFSFMFDASGDPANMDRFLQEVLLRGKNVHIGFSSQDELDLCSYWLQKHVQDFYYIDRPSDVACASRWIDEHGITQPGPGGPLFMYLTSSSEPLLIINFNSFEIEDLIGYNSIIDTQYREADGQRLRDNAIVLGLSVVSPDCYSESNFTGRFFKRVRVAPFISPYPVQFQASARTPIDLFGADDWKEQLTGKWILKKDHCKRKKGLLTKGETSLEIQNGPWDKRDFKYFWLQESLKRNLTISKTTNVKWEQFQDYIRWVETCPAGICPHIINPGLLGRMRTQYQIQDELFDTLPGVIKSNSNSALYAYLTSPLRDEQLYRLLSLCKEQNVRLHLLKPDGNSIPKATIIITPTIDQVHISDAKVINVTDCDTRVLFGMNAKIDGQKFRFSHTYGAIWKLLQAREHVLLNGKFSEPLLDVLMPLLLYGTLTNGQETIEHEGKLTLVTDSTKGLEFFQVRHEDPANEKIVYTIPQLSLKIDPDLHPIDQERLKQLFEALNRDYHVCIEGETGVGKTTFVKEVLAKLPICTLFYGIKELAACICCSDGTIPILFIDEANAQGRQYNCLEGLYTGGIVDDDGTYYPANPLMRVVFCKNPEEYGGERKELAFLKRHPNTITFTALPESYLGSKYQLDNQLLEVFKKVPELTPRELEMITLMPDPHLAAYRIARCALPASKQQAFTDWYAGRFTLKTAQVAIDLGDFELTESRKEICSLMCDLLSVRKKRKSGGIGGLVLEGMPGDGKSHFAEAVLRAMGLQKVEPHEIGTAAFDAYCKIPAKMNPADKRNILLTAFHAGQVVMEEEANVSKAQEPLHNALLMGHDEDMNPAEKPGFFTVRTKNPISMKMRRPASKADMRRTITYAFTPYPQKDVYQILLKQFPQLSQELLRHLCQKKLSLRERLQIIERGINMPKCILKNLPDLPEQKGQTSKLYALAAVMNWLALPISNAHTTDSLRAEAKKENYTKVGEIYSPSYLVELAKRHGFNETTVVESTTDSYVETLKKHLDKGHAPIVFFDVDTATGQPILAQSRLEHAAVCVGYFVSLQGELFFTLLHWAKPLVVSAKDLAASADNLSTDREPETFYKVNKSWRTACDRSDSLSHDLNKIIDNKSYEKAVTGIKSNDTFRNTLVVVR